MAIFEAMEKLIFLGTGCASARSCYNTCFVLAKGNEYFLVDGGGGNGILTQLDRASISLNRIHHIFLSHAHTDHMLGIIWVVRMIGAEICKGKYEGDLNLYCHSELAKLLKDIISNALDNEVVELLDKRIFLIPVVDGDKAEILNCNVQFFDTNNKAVPIYGFYLETSVGKSIAFIGDEPYNTTLKKYVQGVDWLLHESYCLYSEREYFSPYEKAHVTVKEACEVGEELGVKNLVLYHTEDKNLECRKELYTREGETFYRGNLFVPNDLEELIL